MPYRDIEQRNKYERERKATRRLEWITQQGGKCVQCGSTEKLEVDHIDPATKVSHVMWSWSKSRRDEELAKCQLLCNTCHKEKTRIQTYGERQHGTHATYRIGCRCNVCVTFVHEYKRNYRLEIKRQD